MSDPAQLRELAILEALLKQRGVPIPQAGATSRRHERKIPKDAINLDPLSYAERYRRIDGRRFTLSRHKPLRAIYLDDHPDIVVMKPSQVGLSEYAVTKALHALDVGAVYWRTGKRGLNVGYLLPTNKSLSDFSKERFGDVLSEHPHLKQLFSGYDEVTFKQAGDSYLYLRSTFLGGRRNNTAGEGLLSFPADVLIMDEYDRMDPAAVAMAEKRIRASVVRRKLRLSTPTLPGRGIHEAFLASDQRVWEVPCPHCGAWVEMNFFRDVIASEGDAQRVHQPVWKHWPRTRLERATFAVACLHCQHDLDRLADGRWTAQAPEQTSIRGYQVPALAFPNISPRELAVTSITEDPSRLEEFYRSDLGIPFQSGGSGVAVDVLDALADDPPIGAPYSLVTMGVDVGARFHVRISGVAADGVREVMFFGAVSSWAGLDDLVARFDPGRIVIDAQPELHGAKAWQDKYARKVKDEVFHRVYRAFYATEQQKASQLVTVRPDDGIVRVARTMAMDAVLATIRGQAERWPVRVVMDDEIRTHMQAPTRVTTPDRAGDATASWVHTAPDHSYHAMVYDLIAAEVPLRTVERKRPAAIASGGAKGWNPPEAGGRRERRKERP